jgi:transcriptional regulator with XRE-family HTH domain
MTYQVMSWPQQGGYRWIMVTAVHAGPLLREWRERRRLSQLDLSSRTGVSTRHLSCVETGRARPSRELLLYLADELEVPKRATNGGDVELDDGLAEFVLDAYQPILDSGVQRGAFGDGTPGNVSPDASAGTRLLDATGRRT